MRVRPPQVPEAVCLPSLTYHEAWELSYFGANVLHPRTTLPAMKYNIPIAIRNFFNLSAPGAAMHNSSSSINSKQAKKRAGKQGGTTSSTTTSQENVGSHAALCCILLLLCALLQAPRFWTLRPKRCCLMARAPSRALPQLTTCASSTLRAPAWWAFQVRMAQQRSALLQ